MKKLSIALVLVIAAIGLVACGGSSGTTTTASEEAAAPSETTEAEGTETESTEAEAEEESGGAAGGEEAKEEGGAKEAESGSAGSAIDFEANPEGMLMFTAKELTAKAGNDTVDFDNPSPVPHNVAIENSAGETIAETETFAEGTKSTKVELEPGTYTFYCSVPGHREAGMEGTLTVE